jgi:glycosyltransferase 2 family protein
LNNKKILIYAIKVTLTLLLIFFIARKINFSLMVSELKNINYLDFILFLLLSTSSNFLALIRWNFVLRSLGLVLPAKNLIKISYIGFFLNQTVPSSVFGDVSKGWLLIKSNYIKLNVIISIILDRLIPLSILILLVVFFDFDKIQIIFQHIKNSSVGFFPIFLLIALCFCYKKTRQFILSINFIAIKNYFVQLFVSKIDIILSIILTIMQLLVMSFMVWFIANSIQTDISFLLLFKALPLVFLINALPITIGGWGSREFAMIFTLSQFGVDSTSAALISVIFGLSTLISSIPGVYPLKNIGKLIVNEKIIKKKN